MSETIDRIAGSDREQIARGVVIDPWLRVWVRQASPQRRRWEQWRVAAIGRWGVPDARIPVRRWPIRCPECHSAGPFRALAQWVPVLIDDRGDVIEFTDEANWPVLGAEGPGLTCRECGADFYPRLTMYPTEDERCLASPPVPSKPLRPRQSPTASATTRRRSGRLKNT